MDRHDGRALQVQAMKLIRNTTSPYARLAKIALLEKGIEDLEEEIVNPWQDPPPLLAVNSAARVPALVTDEGMPLSESMMIVLWLEKTRPEPPLLHGDIPHVMRRAGVAFGVIEAAVHTVVGRVATSGSPDDTAFDEGKVGLRRRRTMLTGLDALSRDPPAHAGGTPDLSVILAVIALDYVNFRFGAFDWLTPFPVLEELRASVAERPSFAASIPHA